MSKRLTIQQWFARAVAAGIMPDWDNIWVWVNDDYFEIDFVDPTGYNNKPSGDIENAIQLRKDGVDLVELEWLKPTESDIGNMCWHICIDGCIMLFKLTPSNFNKLSMYYIGEYRRCLIATNGNIAPKPEDFKKVYGEI